MNIEDGFSDEPEDISGANCKLESVIPHWFRQASSISSQEWLLLGHIALSLCRAPPPPHPRGDTPYNGLYAEAPPERGIFFRL